jgi:hypothetical protein
MRSPALLGIAVGFSSRMSYMPSRVCLARARFLAYSSSDRMSSSIFSSFWVSCWHSS